MKEFKPAKDKIITRSLRIPEKLAEKLYKIASERDVSFNELVKQCCEFAIEHLN